MDAYWWVSGPPSGRNVVRNIVLNWNQFFPGDELTVRVRARDYVAVQQHLHTTDIKVQTFPRIARVHALAAMTMCSRRDRHDVVITQNFASLTARVAKVVLVHDAIFVEHPEWFTRGERAYLALLRPTLRSSDLILTTSRSETRRIERLWPEVRGRCFPVGLGGPAPRPYPGRRPSMPIGEDAPFFLAVGRLNVRKNLARLVQAMSLAFASGVRHHLVVVGGSDGAAEELIIPEAVRGYVHFLGFIGDDELTWLYRNTAAFVFPSLDEGFGLPILEASQNGAIVVASDIPAFRETGLVDLFFDPLRLESIADALVKSVRGKRQNPRGFDHSWQQTVIAMRSAITSESHYGGIIE